MVLSATGTARKRTLPAIRERDLCEVVAIHGRDAVRLEETRRAFAIPVSSTDAAALLDRSRPDFVFIASPPALHGEQVQLCLDRRIPVLCEKPLALTSAEAARLGELAERHGVPLRVGHHLRFAPGFARVRQLIDRGELGAVQRAALEWSFWLDEESRNARWKLDPAAGGPHAFFDAGMHVIDMMLHLLPPPAAVSAVAAQRRFSRIADTVTAQVRCGGMIADLVASFADRVANNDLAMEFDQGRIFAANAFAEQGFGRLTFIDGRYEDFAPVNLYGAVIEDFLGLLNDRPSLATTVAEAVRALVVAEAMTASYSSGSTVRL